MKAAVVSIAAIAALLMGSTTLPAQTQAAAPQAKTQAAKPAAAAPAPTFSSLDPFPVVNPKYFTADQPTPETVNAFLKQLWGYDVNRIWSVQRILKTPAPGVSKVIVYVTEHTPNAQVQATSFFVLPDQKHAMSAGDIMNFGPTPFAENRKMIQERATGQARGSASKDLMLVEFVDLQCPHCKEAQTTMENLIKDFPNARVVTMNFPLVDLHPAAYKAAAYGICVAQKGGNDAYFKYVQAVFDRQDALTAEGTEQTLADAVTYAGQDPAATATCAAEEATKAKLNAQIQLGVDLNISLTPSIAINGRILPLGEVPYDVLKQIINYQALQDGVSTGAKPAASPFTTPPTLR